MAFNPFEPTEKEKQFNPFEPEINDDDNVFEAAYHGLAGAAGNVIKTAGHMLNYEGKPAYMSDEEWARRQDGSTVFGINKAIENFGREMEEKHQRNYSEPLGANSIASGIGSVVPYAVALGLTARSGRAIDPAGLGEAAGVQLGQKVAPRFGQTAARITEAVVPGLALGQRQAFPEALIEMENAQEDYIENAKAQGKYKPGVTEAEAERISRSVLEGNLGFITGTDAAQNALINSIALGQGSRGRRALQAVGIGGGINAAQEIGQQIIPKEAKGEDWSFTDPDIVASGIIGSITGGLPSAVAAAIDSRSRTADNFGENAVNDALNAGIAGAANAKEAFINAIAGQESGGDYNAVNGRTGAAGKYQIMPENWPAWAEEAGIGSDAEMTPENQEIVARFKLGQYYDKYGARDAAIAWYGGEGAINYSDEAKNRKQGNGNEPSINEYADSVMARMGAGVGRRDLRSMYTDDTDQAIADMNNTPAIRLPEQRQDIDFSGRGEVEDNSALNSFNEADARRAMARNEAADYAEPTGEETDNVQQWNTPQQRTLRMPRRTGGVTYNPVTAMETPYLDRLNRQAVNRRADDLAMENQRVMQETAGRRQRFTGQGTPTFQALMQRTLAARSQRQQNLNNALRSNNLANLTARAMSGDHGARQTFDKLRPEVRSVLLNRAIDRLNVQNMDEQADEARKALKLAQEQQETKERAQREADKRELLQGAEEYLRSSYDSPAEGARAELRDAKAGINSLLQPIIDQLREGMGNGITLAPGREDGRMVRISNNAPWYQEWHKEHKRKPTQRELEDIARDIYTGRNSYGLPGWEVNQENEAEFEQNRATLQEMDDFVDAYEQLEKKFVAEPNGGRRSGTSEESNAGEVAARRQAETEQAGNENAETESEVSIKAISIEENNKNQPLPAAEDRRAADTSNGTSSVTGDTGFSTSTVVQETENVKADTADNTQDGARQAETGRQEQTPVRAEKVAETEAEPSEQAKKRIGEKFNVFDTGSDNYAREIEINKIRKVGGNYYYGDSRNVSLYKIDDIATGQSAELDNEIAREQARIDKAVQRRREIDAERAQIAKRDSVGGYTDNMSAMQRGKIAKTLNKHLTYSDENGRPVVMSRAEHIRDVAGKGFAVTAQKLSNGKTEYRVYDNAEGNGPFEIITKAEFDYYNWYRKQQPAQSAESEVSKKAVSVEENIANGKKAMQKVIDTHENAENAMYREDVGDITFVWGSPGRGKNFKGGYGVSHIIAKHENDRANITDEIPAIIARGDITNRQTAPLGDRVTIEYNDRAVVLSLYENGNRKTWLVTGWDNRQYKEKTAPSATTAVYDADGATTGEATRSRQTGDDTVSTPNVAQETENVKADTADTIEGIRASLKAAGVKDEAADAIEVFLQARAATVYPDNPGRYFKEHPVAFVRGRLSAKGDERYYQAAYHGSPHVFERFDLGAIGTGEGAQAHGWGLYFAGDRQVAEGYKERLGKGVGRLYEVEIPESEVMLDEDKSFAHQTDTAKRLLVKALNNLPEEQKRKFGEQIKMLTSSHQYTFEDEGTAELYRKKANGNGFMFARLFGDTQMRERVLREAGYSDSEATRIAGNEVEFERVALKQTEEGSKASEKLQKIIDEFFSHTYNERPGEVLYRYPQLTGEDVYFTLAKAFHSNSFAIGGKEASLHLNKNGLEGITYDGKRDGRCYVVFDDNAVSVINRYNQMAENGEIKGAIGWDEQGKAVISLFKGNDVSTVLHETGHYFIEALGSDVEAGRATAQQKADWNKLLNYAGIKGHAEWRKLDFEGRRPAHEKLATAMEQYVMEGKAPSKELEATFARFKKWLGEVYKSVKNFLNKNKDAEPLTDDVRRAFDRMFTREASNDTNDFEQVRSEMSEYIKNLNPTSSKMNKLASTSLFLYDKLQEKRITPQQLKQLQEEASTAIGNQQSAPAQEEKTPEKPKEPKAKIEDFGEKIGGARKDVYAVYKELFGKAEKLDVETVPLSKSWPEPDYEKLIENGADERKVALFRATRDAIPAKPRSGRGASDWVYMVKTLREYANNILNGDGEVDFDAEQKKYKNRTFNRIIGRAKLYEVAGHKYSLKGIALEPHSYLAFMGERYKTPKTFWVVEQQAKASALSAFPKILAYGTSEAEAIKKFKDSYENIVAGKAKKPQVSFEIYIDSKTKGPFIGKKIRGNVIRLKEGFKSIAEAREYKAKHEDELIAQLEKIKEVPMERGDINHPRVGADMRGGKDVTPEMFTEAFGFRGVEFGNWVENDRRQQDLNNAYDALMDMAAIINIKPKAISLNGTLGLAFGARGRGGKNAASAHYEPGFMAINLTKMNGAGSLGHEWFHALDNMFGKKSKATYASASGNVALRQFGINNVDVAGDIRPEVVDAFAGIRRAILKSGMYNRAQKLDSVRTKDYWGTMEEMHARAFEKYLIDKLRDQGASNDYLANILTEEQWNAAAASGVNKDNTYPYPTDKEMPEIRAAFDNLFNVIEQVETDKGVMLNEEVQSYGVDDIMNVSEEYYQQALFDYPEIASSERVKNRVRNSIQGTLDFGALPEEILETASEQDVSQDKKRDTGRDIQYGGTSGKIPQLSKTLGIGITRQLVNDGAISLTGKKINSLQELAEYAQVLRHPGYEKFHRVYVNKNGVIIGHETISTMMPSETRVVEGRDDNERAENANKHADMLRANKDIAKVYYIHNHPSGNPEPSLLDMDVTRDYLSQAAGDKFGGHIVLDTTQYAQIDGGGNVTYGEISDGKQIKYDVAGLPHKALGRKLLSNTVARLVKTLDDSSKTTVFFTDAKLNVRAVVQLPEGVNRLSTAGLNRYLRLKARDNYSSRALISTSDKVVYEKAKTLVQNGRLIEAILTKDRDVALSGRTEIENSGGTAEEDGTFFGETSRDRGAMRLLEENKRYINTPSQIKSASENNGEFNTDTPDIRYAATTEPAAQRSREEVLRELQDALPNGKFEDAGNGECTVTLPNNARIKVNIADRMVVNNHEAARVRGAHGLMRGGELNIEGSWQSFKGSDVDGLLNLSRTGRAGTAYHEVMHAAMDFALTEKEQQAMVKHFNKEAQATGKTVSEAISDGYVEWKRARAQRRGTLFGKLYNKMQDMLNTLKSLFTGVENAHNVMRRVESGEVWQRSRNTLYSGDGAPKFNVSGNKISQFINIALKNADKNLRLLLGRVSDGEAKAIKDSTGYDVSGFTHVWLSEDVRHIQNRHGVKTEKVKGQIGLTEADMIEALEAIKAPNKIEKGSPTRNGEPSIRFIKQTGTGEYTVVEVVRQKNKRLAVKTMWKTASENTKEAATATLRADNSPQYTSETDSGETASVRKNINQSSSFNQNISQQSPEVNGSDVQYSAQELTPEQKVGKAVINTERKGTFQKAKEWIKKQKDEFYRDWFDKNTSLNDLVAGLEMTLGRKLTEGENIYNRVQTLPSTAAGMATALIEGGVEHLKVINSRLKNVKLKHFVTLQMVLDNINREKMDKAHPDYLKRGGFKTWIDAFGAYLTSIRLNEMLLLHDEAYQQKVNEWKQRVAARQKWEADGAKGVPPQEAIHQEWEDFQKALDRAYRKWSDKNGNNKQGDDPRIAMRKEWLKTHKTLDEPLKTVGKKPEYKPYLLPKGLTQDDIESVIKNAPPEFRKAAQMYWQFNDNVLTIMEDAGLISGETHKLLNTKYKYYCPLMRDFSDTAAADAFIGGLGNGGRGIGNVSNMLKKIGLEGSERAVLNPLESTVKAVAVACNRAERNKVGQLAVQLAEKGGMDGVIQKVEGTTADAKNCVFTVMFDGKKQAYKTTPELYDPIVGYNLPSASFVFGVARNAARLLRAGATSSPSFIIRNVIRDTIFAGVSSKNGFIPVVDTIRGMYALARDPRLKAEFKVAGVTAFKQYSNAETAVKSLDQMAGGKAWRNYDIADWWNAFIGKFQSWSEFAEAGTRMGEFMRARANGKSLEEAARDAREVTLDFSRSGVYGERVNRYVPFFNAVLQGGDKMVRLIKDDPVNTAVKLTKYIILPSLVFWLFNHDEDWYKELDPEIKATCWILPGGVIRIPKPQEAGILFGSGIEAVLDQAFDKDPEAISNWAEVFRENILPSIFPTVFLPLWEWKSNYSNFRDATLVPQRLQNLPDELQYTPNTSAAARTLGGALKLSPVKIDNAIRGYTGTMGMTLVQQLDWFADEKQNMPYKKVSEWPFLRDFTVNQNIQNRSVDDFYKMLNKANEQHAGYGKKGKPTPAVQGVRKAGQLISKAQKDIRELTVNPRLSPEAKRQRIDQRKAYIKNVAEKANMRFGRFFDD